MSALSWGAQGAPGWWNFSVHWLHPDGGGPLEEASPGAAGPPSVPFSAYPHPRPGGGPFVTTCPYTFNKLCGDNLLRTDAQPASDSPAWHLLARTALKSSSNGIEHSSKSFALLMQR